MGLTRPLLAVRAIVRRESRHFAGTRLRCTRSDGLLARLAG